MNRIVQAINSPHKSNSCETNVGSRVSVDKFQSNIDAWLTDEPTRWQRVTRGLTALWHAKISRKIRAWTIVHWLAKTLMASSAPFLAWYFYGTISAGVAASASVAIFIGYSLTAFFDYASKVKTADENGVVELTTRFGELMQSFPRARAQHPHVDDHIRSALGIIESVATAVTGSSRGTISVCLAMYEGSKTERMRIRHRSPGSKRRTNKSFDGKGTIAHYACISGSDPRVVHDIREFGAAAMRSPTQSEVTYRSIYIVPIIRSGSPGERVCGFISIDSTKPYAFYGNKANSIIVVCEPIIHHIQDLLAGGEQ